MGEDATSGDPTGARDSDSSAEDSEASPETDDAPAEARTRSRLVAERETRRWYGIAGVALVAAGAAVYTTTPALLLASAVCAGVLGAIRVAPTPTPEIVVDRSFDSELSSGDKVEIVVTVRNVGGTLPDIRLIDRPPETVPVVGGSARRAGLLRREETMRTSYTVAASRGRHEFGAPVLIARDLFGTTEREYELAVPDELIVQPDFRPLEAAPVRALATGHVGRLPTDRGGSGIEFYQTREYRPGDPMNRIDWNRLAKTDELATLEFRTERSASVVIVADVREEAFVSPGEGTLSAAAVGLGAVDRLFPTFLDAGDAVGLAALDEKVTWLAPGSGPTHRARGQELLANNPAFSTDSAPETMRSILGVRDLRRRLSETDQLVVCSPLCDDSIERTIRMLDAYGNRATVVSPDPTTTDTPGHTVAQIERRQRIDRLRRAGVRVVDWSPGTNLDTAIARASERWAR